MAKEQGLKNFMNLSNDECINIAKETLNNANQLYEEGQILSNNKSYGRAISLLILSLEETMKALILYLDGNGFEFRSRVKGIKNLFINHKLRYPLAFVLSVMHILINDIMSLLKRSKNKSALLISSLFDIKILDESVKQYIFKKTVQLKSEIEWYRSAEYLRNEGIYVDYNNELKTPQNFKKEDYDSVYIRMRSMRGFIDLFIRSFSDLDEETYKQLKNTQRQFIEKNWYEKIGNLITTVNTKNTNPMTELVNYFQK